MTNVEKRPLKERTSKEYFGEVFKRLLNEWCAVNGKNQKDFAKLIGEKQGGTEVNKNSITDWKNGKIPKEYTLAVICEIFGVDEEEFVPKTITDKTLHSKEYVTKVGIRNSKYAEVIGLDLRLLSFLRENVDFDGEFPLYSEFDVSISPEKTKKTFQRNEHYELSREMDDELKIFQIKRGKKKPFILSLSDLDYLKDLQDQIVRDVQYHFYMRHKEMEEEEFELNRLCLRVGNDPEHLRTPTREEYKSIVSDPESSDWEVVKLRLPTFEEVTSIDKYGDYGEGGFTDGNNKTIRERKVQNYSIKRKGLERKTDPEDSHI